MVFAFCGGGAACAAAEVIVVGDNPHDLAMATRAGVRNGHRCHLRESDCRRPCAGWPMWSCRAIRELPVSANDQERLLVKTGSSACAIGRIAAGCASEEFAVGADFVGFRIDFDLRASPNCGSSIPWRCRRACSAPGERRSSLSFSRSHSQRRPADKVTDERVIDLPKAPNIGR